MTPEPASGSGEPLVDELVSAITELEHASARGHRKALYRAEKAIDSVAAELSRLRCASLIPPREASVNPEPIKPIVERELARLEELNFPKSDPSLYPEITL